MTHHSPSDKSTTKPFDNRRINYSLKGEYQLLAMRNREITHAQKLAAVMICYYCMHGRDHAWLTNKGIADLIGCDEKYAGRCVKRLVEVGLLQKFDKARKGRDVLRPNWELVDEWLASKGESDDDHCFDEDENFIQQDENFHWQDENFIRQGGKFPPKTEYIDREIQTEKRRNRNPAATASGFASGLVRSGRVDQSPEPVNDNYPDNAFDQFWTIYPSKVGKRDAKAAFAEASHRVTFEVMLAGLRKYINKDDDRALCNPSTWLNGDRWEDEPAQKPNAGMDNDSIDRRIRSQRRAAI